MFIMIVVFYIFICFFHLMSNHVSILLYHTVLSDTYKRFSRWGMIQEKWLPKEETEMRQHLTINIDTKPNRVLQTGGVWLHYDVLHILSTTQLGWVNFLVHLWICRYFQHIISIPVKTEKKPLSTSTGRKDVMSGLGVLHREIFVHRLKISLREKCLQRHCFVNRHAVTVSLCSVWLWLFVWLTKCVTAIQ
jgi:hypothetical protein